jgi:hypothetical protein
VTAVTLAAAPGSGAPAGPVRIGLEPASGRAVWIATVPASGGVRIRLPRPRWAVAVTAAAGARGASLAAPLIFTAGGARYRADGPLQDALLPPRWRLRGFDGGFAVFSDALARPPLALRALPGTAGGAAVIRATAGPGFAPSAARVSSARGATVIRSVADAAGWTASWRPADAAAAMPLPVRRAGLVQAVTVPAGKGTITWAYAPPGAVAGLWLSLAGLALLAGLLSAARLRRGGPAAAPPVSQAAGMAPAAPR